MLIGYARVSTDDQDTAAQVAALQAAGCERIFREKASGGHWERPQFLRLLHQLRAGDVVVVWKLDRLSRSLRDVLTIMEQLGVAGAGFRSLTEAIDTTTPAGRMMMQMVGAFAEFERAMLRERTQAGVDAARQEGRVGGRRPKLSRNSNPRFERWFRKAIRPPPLLHASSRSTQPPSRGCSSESPRRLRTTSLEWFRNRTEAQVSGAALAVSGEPTTMCPMPGRRAAFGAPPGLSEFRYVWYAHEILPPSRSPPRRLGIGCVTGRDSDDPNRPDRHAAEGTRP